LDSPDIIYKYFNKLSTKQKFQLTQLGSLYEDWNQKINVISRKDLEHLYERHVLHCLGIAKIIQFKSGTTVLDVGTGGGFPGIPLAILFPDSRFHLVDSIGKKIKVVNEIVTETDLQNVTVEKIRAEDIDEKFDFICSRAVTRIKPFYDWVHSKINTKSINDINNGLLCIKGGELSEEIRELNKSFQLFELKNYFSEDFFESKKIIHVPA
jgi:16S rRNA (guanine527-N7)-methyltransferase